MAGGALPTPLERALRHVAAMSAGQALDAQVPVTLNFHPDRLARGRPVLDQLAADGRYLSQFATGTSNGGLTAYPAGDRWRWESRIFGGAYELPGEADRRGAAFRVCTLQAGPPGPRAHHVLLSGQLSRAFRFRRRLGHGAHRPGYRGQEYVDLGAEIAVGGQLDPRIIGEAERTGRYAPQDLKKVWHYLARFGAPEMLAMD